MINRLLQKDPAGRGRKLRLRTYAVICLNEECGVLEWVQVRRVRVGTVEGGRGVKIGTTPMCNFCDNSQL